MFGWTRLMLMLGRLTRVHWLVWRGGRIDHAGSEHDDYCNAVAGVVEMALGRGRRSYACPRCEGAGCHYCGGTGRLFDLGISFTK